MGAVCASVVCLGVVRVGVVFVGAVCVDVVGSASQRQWRLGDNAHVQSPSLNKFFISKST